jgi:hypothetical protein
MKEVLLVVLGAVMAKLAELGLEVLKHYRARRGTLSLAHLEDVMQWGWNGATLLHHLIALDRRLLGDLLTDAREGTSEQWAPVFMAHPETWALLTTGPKQIKGYWCFTALNDAQFRRAKAGELLDSEITLDTVAQLDIPGIY